MLAKINLLNETQYKLTFYNKKSDDVRWIGTRDGKSAISWAEFEIMANFEYDADYGLVRILEELCVVGDNWWLERREYDGSEWWEFKTLPTLNADHVALETLYNKSSDDA